MSIIPDSIKINLIKMLIIKLRNINIFIKFIYIILLLTLLLLVSRLGYLGEGLKTLSNNIIPYHLKYIDPEPERLNIYFSFEYLDSNIYKPVTNNGNYKSNTIMLIKYRTNVHSWVLIVGVDNYGIHPLLDTELNPVEYTPYSDRSFDHVDFKLDDKIGDEAYIIFSSTKKFSFNTDIKPYLLLNKKNVSSKGAVLINHIETAPSIIYKSINIRHTD